MLMQEGFVCQGIGDLLPGGKGAGHSWTEFDPLQVCQGIRVEMEHTTDPKIALEIAVDHLTEDPRYYTKLATIHVDGARLGDARSDTIALLSSILGEERAAQAVSDLETVVANQAESRVRPLVIGAMAVGALGVIAGGIALVLAARR